MSPLILLALMPMVLCTLKIILTLAGWLAWLLGLALMLMLMMSLSGLD